MRVKVNYLAGPNTDLQLVYRGSRSLGDVMRKPARLVIGVSCWATNHSSGILIGALTRRASPLPPTANTQCDEVDPSSCLTSPHLCIVSTRGSPDGHLYLYSRRLTCKASVPCSCVVCAASVK